MGAPAAATLANIWIRHAGTLLFIMRLTHPTATIPVEPLFVKTTVI